VLIVDERWWVWTGGHQNGQGHFKNLAAGNDHFHVHHTLKVAEDLCDRIGIIHKGSLIALERPRN